MADPKLHTYAHVTKAYAALEEEEKAVSLAWLRANFQPAKTLCKVGSYGLKHYLQRVGGPYMLEEAFKGMLIAEGYRPERTEPNVSGLFYMKPKAKRWDQVPGHPG